MTPQVTLSVLKLTPPPPPPKTNQDFENDPPALLKGNKRPAPELELKMSSSSWSQSFYRGKFTLFTLSRWKQMCLFDYPIDIAPQLLWKLTPLLIVKIYGMVSRAVLSLAWFWRTRKDSAWIEYGSFIVAATQMFLKISNLKSLF